MAGTGVNGDGPARLALGHRPGHHRHLAHPESRDVTATARGGHRLLWNLAYQAIEE